MGREIKRVPLDFQWPLHMQWKGFMNPYSSQDCTVCDGSGQNPETKKIADDWYDFEHTGRRWCNAITQDEVQALLNKGRLHEFTRANPDYVPTASEVNEWSRTGIGHDALNHWICVETRARRLGVWGVCPVCNGEGAIWFSDDIKQRSDEWYEKERYEPPQGEGWQVWETVSEGSPISPVFAMSDELVDWLMRQGYSEHAARAFIDHSWVPSMVIRDGLMASNIAALDLM